MIKISRYFGIRSHGLVLLVIILNLFTPSAIQAENLPQKVQIVTIDYPPTVGGPEMIMSKIAAEAFQAEGITTEFIIYPLSRVSWALTKGKFPAVLGTRGWFQQSDKPPKILPVVIYLLELKFFSLKKNFPQGVRYQKLEDLQKHKIGYLIGGTLNHIFEKAKLKTELVSTLAQNIRMLYADRIDMIAATKLNGQAIISKYYPNDADKFTMSEQTIHSIYGDLVFAEDQQQLKKIFQRGFDTIRENGTYLRVLKETFKDQQIPENLLDINRGKIIKYSE